MFWKSGSKSTRSSNRTGSSGSTAGSTRFSIFYFLVFQPGQPGFLLKNFEKTKPSRDSRTGRYSLLMQVCDLEGVPPYGPFCLHSWVPRSTLELFGLHFRVLCIVYNQPQIGLRYRLWARRVRKVRNVILTNSHFISVSI